MSYVFYNGSFILKNQCLFDIENRSFRYGDGLFETIKVINKKIHYLQYHNQRLYESATLLSLNSQPIIDVLNNTLFDFLSFSVKSVIDKLLDINNLSDCVARLILFRSDASSGYLPLNHNLWNICVETNKYDFNINPSTSCKNCDSFDKNLSYFKNFETLKDLITIDTKQKAIISPIIRVFNPSLPVFSKTANSMQFVMAKLQADSLGMFDGLMINNNGFLCEFSSGNLFFVKNQLLHTPHCNNGIVKGVMRSFIIDFLKTKNIVVNEANFTIQDLQNADEIYFTNSIRGIIPIEIMF